MWRVINIPKDFLSLFSLWDLPSLKFHIRTDINEPTAAKTNFEGKYISSGTAKIWEGQLVPPALSMHTDLDCLIVSKKLTLHQYGLQPYKKSLKFIVRYFPSLFLSIFLDLDTFPCIFCP